MPLRKALFLIFCFAFIFQANAEVQHALSGLKTFMELGFLLGMADVVVFMCYLSSRKLFFLVLSLLLGVLLFMIALFLLDWSGWMNEDIISIAGILALVFSSIQLLTHLYFGVRKLKQP
jgi:hypothetical protein